MNDISEHLRDELKDAEYSEAYAESFLDSYIATQIKVLREQAGLSQQGLAELIGTKQGAISRIEDVNYSNWNVKTLKKLARAFRVRLRVSFETYCSLIAEAQSFSRDALQREPREADAILNARLADDCANGVRRRKRHLTKKSRRGHIKGIDPHPVTLRDRATGSMNMQRAGALTQAGYSANRASAANRLQELA
jgi:transcriptional regulator with XRE-family HTH domain